MALERVDTVVIGAGQAGIAVSEHLSKNRTAHVVLERGRIAESWRTARWDSLVANGPAWHDRFPNLEFEGNQDSFISKDAVADYFTAYAEKFNAPVRSGVEVQSVVRKDRERGFLVSTDKGPFEALNVIVATGAFHKPSIPPIIAETAGLLQMHSSEYRNPAHLQEGNILVVGAGSSGVQIADELARSGRKVYLSVGPHDRPPRTYRGRDFVWWLGVLGKWNAQAQAPGAEHVTIAVSGARNGETIDFRKLAELGMTLVGRTESFENGTLRFADDVGRNIARGDENYLSLLDEADAYIERNGLDLPEEPQARVFGPTPDCITHPIHDLNLKEAGITTIIWATGFRVDYSWVKLNIFDENGRPIHQRGVSREPGMYFLGLPWLSGRGSSFIWGVWHDAKYVADHILIQQQYRDYKTTTERLRAAAE
ncbi:flavin-containing monooxygenase [Roseibium litorale]|uniref:NAD(P)-binding domain-containing protein n=1 Tax=Roseibium litorale TaxID=2803841 RepID=A0ABR9CTQ4_9HYPH|nr:NAD(P)/FAD-dependent oxidoreductase [Roseibium litorale]MBD8893666.1 NAD(P)-binding domain-containing protein [Roseibium litorale]